jgi:hypothetical protein
LLYVLSSFFKENNLFSNYKGERITLFLRIA